MIEICRDAFLIQSLYVYCTSGLQKIPGKVYIIKKTLWEVRTLVIKINLPFNSVFCEVFEVPVYAMCSSMHYFCRWLFVLSINFEFHLLHVRMAHLFLLVSSILLYECIVLFGILFVASCFLLIVIQIIFIFSPNIK